MRWKLSRHASIRLFDLHGWAGVLAGLPLYVMFSTGAITLFHEPLERWQEPLAQQPQAARPLQWTLARGLAALGRTPDELWFFPPGEQRGAAKIAYREPGSERWCHAWVDAEHGRLVPERERLADFLESVHYLWHDAIGTWLYTCAGLLAVLLLVASVTGVAFHLKHLWAQFYRFRPRQSARLVWSDLHKVLGVMGLPFQVMVAYTGAMLVLGPLLLRVFTGPVFAGDAQRAAALAWGIAPDAAPSPGSVSAVLELDELVASAAAARPRLVPDAFKLLRFGQPGARVEASGWSAASPRVRMTMKLDRSDGPLERRAQDLNRGPAAGLRRWVQGLHFAAFGGLTLRLLFFALALCACATLVSGNQIWLARRAARRAFGKAHVLGRLTVGVAAGTWVAIAALFLASRSLPLDFHARASAQELIFIGTLGACVLWALVARDPGALWHRQLGLAAALLLPVPALAARWSEAGLFGAGPRDALVFGVDVGLSISALALAACAVLLRKVWLHGRRSGAAATRCVESVEQAGAQAACDRGLRSAR